MVKQARVISPETERALFEQMGDRDRALFGICLYTGCRIAEACQLKRDHLEGDYIYFPKAITKGGKESREILILPRLRGLLDNWLAHDTKSLNGFLFPGRHGRGHIHPNAASNLLRTYTAAIGEPGISTHSFRRTALTRMKDAGIPLATIQSISGHQSLYSLQRYLEVTPEDKKTALEAIVAG